MIAPLTSRDRRALLLGAAAAALSLCWMLGVRPLLQRADELQHTLQRERALLARESGTAQAAGRYTGAFRAGAPRLIGLAPRLFAGRDGMAAAALARYVEEAAASNRVFIKRVDPSTPQQIGDGLNAIGVTVAGASDLEGLLSFLYALEFDQKLVQVGDLSVRGLRPGERPAPTVPEALDFELTATGYVLMPWAGRGGGAP